MEKTCLVFMPSEDQIGYAAGHFNRIFDYIIVPACKAANLNAFRADVNLETIKSVINAEMVLCDLSASNTEVRYAFALRQALDLPIALIKDTKTPVDYLLSEFLITEYDESLRIDIVQNAINSVAQALRVGDRGEAGLLRKLSIPIEIGVPNSNITSFVYSEPIQEPVVVPIIYPDFVGEGLTERDIEKLKAGDSIYHTTHGKGVITTIKIMAQDKMANIQFDNGTKLLVLGTSGIFRKIIED